MLPGSPGGAFTCKCGGGQFSGLSYEENMKVTELNFHSTKRLLVSTPASERRRVAWRGFWATGRADPRAMQVVVPAGVRPGQAFNVQTPTGAMLQTVVPAGVEPGQTIMITTEQTMQPAQPAQMTMQREDLSAEDAAAAREIAAGLVGTWQGRGYSRPCCFCPLICCLPMTLTGSMVIGPLGANNTYPTETSGAIWICPFLGLPCSIFHIIPIATVKTQGEIDASGTTLTSRSRATNIKGQSSSSVNTWTLTSVDAKERRATYSLSSSVPNSSSMRGTRVIDGRATTI